MPGREFQDEIRLRVARRKQHYRDLAELVSKRAAGAETSSSAAASDQARHESARPSPVATAKADRGAKPAASSGGALGAKQRPEVGPKRR